MKTRPDTNPAAQNGVDAGRRNALKLAGLGVATLGMMPLLNVSTAKAQDMSNGANNFYTSDKVNLQKVTFKDQYQMNVVGTSSPRSRLTETPRRQPSSLGTRWAL